MSQVLITRSKAITLVREITNSDWTERDILDFVDCLAALNLIKFNTNQDENVLIEARKLSAEYVEFDFNHPGNTISRMSRIIGRLLEIIEGLKK